MNSSDIQLVVNRALLLTASPYTCCPPCGPFTAVVFSGTAAGASSAEGRTRKHGISVPYST